MKKIFDKIGLFEFITSVLIYLPIIVSLRFIPIERNLAMNIIIGCFKYLSFIGICAIIGLILQYVCKKFDLDLFDLE